MLESLAGVDTDFEFAGTADLTSEVTIRYWKAITDGQPLVLNRTINLTVPVGSNGFAFDEITQDFELTTGSEIEIVVTTQAKHKSLKNHVLH